jgi:purine-binding chemotaxis protein CheW
MLAIPLDRVRGVVPARPFTALPGAVSPVRGVINVRGRIVTVVDLAAHLGYQDAADQPDHRIVIVEAAGRQIGLAASDVLRILRVLPEEMASGAALLDGRSIEIIDPDPILQPIFG